MFGFFLTFSVLFVSLPFFWPLTSKSTIYALKMSCNSVALNCTYKLQYIPKKTLYKSLRSLRPCVLLMWKFCFPCFNGMKSVAKQKVYNPLTSHFQKCYYLTERKIFRHSHWTSTPGNG